MMNKQAIKLFSGILAIGAVIALIGLVVMISSGGYSVWNYVTGFLALGAFGYGANYLYQKSK